MVKRIQHIYRVGFEPPCAIRQCSRDTIHSHTARDGAEPWHVSTNVC